VPSLLNKFIRTTAGSKHQDTDYKPTISSSGDFTKTIGLETILNSWNTILQIPTRTYFFDPPFGCDIFKRIFDPADQITLDLIKDEIENQLFGNDDRARVESIDVKFLRNKKGYTVNVYVIYKGERGNVKAIIDEATYLNVLG
jgi:phage baseplate assembly protein W